MDSLLKGKRAVVTGAGRGIGRAVALAFAEQGAKVVVNDLGTEIDGSGASTSVADEVVAEIARMGGIAVPSYDSVAEYASAGRIVEACVKAYGGIDILVSNAGFLRNGPCYGMQPEDWDAVVKTHLYGCFYLAHHATPYMREQKWGRIIAAASNAYRGLANNSAYSAAKGGIVSFVRSLAFELAQDGITCNCYSPGAKTRQTGSDSLKSQMEQWVKEGSVSRRKLESMLALPGPESIAPLVAYLASDYAAGISGAVFGCVGGMVSIHNVPDEVRTIFKDYETEGPWTIDELRRLIPKTTAPSPLQMVPQSKETRREG